MLRFGSPIKKLTRLCSDLEKVEIGCKSGGSTVSSITAEEESLRDKFTNIDHGILAVYIPSSSAEHVETGTPLLCFERFPASSPCQLVN